MDRPGRSTVDAYVTYLAHIEAGEIPACVPVEVNGQPGIYTIGGIVPTGVLRTSHDGVAAAIVAIQKARQQAINLGLHPL